MALNPDISIVVEKSSEGTKAANNEARIEEAILAEESYSSDLGVDADKIGLMNTLAASILATTMMATPVATHNNADVESPKDDHMIEITNPVAAAALSIAGHQAVIADTRKFENDIDHTKAVDGLGQQVKNTVAGQLDTGKSIVELAHTDQAVIAEQDSLEGLKGEVTAQSYGAQAGPGSSFSMGSGAAPVSSGIFAPAVASGAMTFTQAMSEATTFGGTSKYTALNGVVGNSAARARVEAQIESTASAKTGFAAAAEAPTAKPVGPSQEMAAKPKDDEVIQEINDEIKQLDIARFKIGDVGKETTDQMHRYDDLAGQQKEHVELAGDLFDLKQMIRAREIGLIGDKAQANAIDKVASVEHAETRELAAEALGIGRDAHNVELFSEDEFNKLFENAGVELDHMETPKLEMAEFSAPKMNAQIASIA